MIQFPSSTFVGRVIPKEAFYQRLNLSAELKARFVSDIRRITIEHSLSEHTLHLKPGAEVGEIIVLGIELKIQALDERLLGHIARQNKHKLLFWLRFEGQGRLGVYFNKLYTSGWQPQEALDFVPEGTTNSIGRNPPRFSTLRMRCPCNANKRASNSTNRRCSRPACRLNSVGRLCVHSPAEVNTG